MKKLGLDLGSSSNGWAIREDDKITANGVVTFKTGMNKGTNGYSSPTKDRREARSKRKLIQARKYRKWELLEILLNEFVPVDKQELENWSKYKKGQVQVFPENVKFLKWLACDFAYEGGIKYTNPYELRVKALDNTLSKHEFGRALYHLVQRRGYKNIGENDTEEFDVELAKKDAETKTQIERREKEGFANAMNKNRTVAEALKNEFLNNGKRARNQYPLRREYRKELEEICKGQGYDISKNEKGNYNNEFVQKLYNAIIWQRPLRSQKGNIGKCTLEPTKPRCPVSHPVFEIFRAWSFINTIKFADNDSDEKQFLSDTIREKLFSDFFLKQDKNFKFEEIRKYLDKEFKSNKTYNYPFNKKDKIYDSSVAGMPVSKGLIKVIGEKAKDEINNIYKYNIGTAPKIINNYSLYDLWHILFEFDEKHLEKFAIEKLSITNEKTKKGEEYNPFLKLKNNIIQGYSDLSLKAMCKIIPFLQEGYLYNEATVLAKMPELLGDKWEEQKEVIKNCIQKSNSIYNQNKIVASITNNLIDKYKGDIEQWRTQGTPIKAWNDFTYTLNKDDLNDIEKSCISHIGENKWENRKDKNELIEEVKNQYQLFFKDSKRIYREVPLLTNILKELLKENNIEMNGNLYHHSNRENLYLKKDKKLPIDTKTGLELLPTPIINSIKNPMFNKSLTILRKLINELIRTNKVDKDTEVVVEVARELNDNNKRAAIERYQRFREDNREKYRQFLNEFKENENKSINVEESISQFELWTEQSFEKTKDENGKEINKNTAILKEKNAIKRYELWMEQKGQCMYTGDMISISQLFSNEIDIMHTIPRSLLPDNTMANMTVGFSRYNRDLQKQKFPKECDNYYKYKEGWGTKIDARLENWITIREGFKVQYEKRTKPSGSEDEATKNKRIQEKHYYKMHFDYWKDKVERFEATEVKDSWARRQLVDTQMVSKYAREYLKTYFKKVAVQKGSVTADFRKIYNFQEQDEIKSRNKHTHHSIDAAVLTLIPTNSSYRERLLKKMYETYENERKQFTTSPYPEFNSQKLINDIENNTLIVNYEKDTIVKETYKTVRKRGRIQYVKNKKGEFVLDKEGNKIVKVAKGDTVRSTLYAQTYLGKIRDVERDDFEKEIKIGKSNLSVKVKGFPKKRQANDWIYKQGKDEFVFVVRKSLKDALSNIDDIVDPVIREIVRQQKENAIDPQGKKIRHVRIKTKAGQIVKDRINYRSEKDYKNKFYSSAGSLPYAILLQNSNNGKVERELIPIASFEIAKHHKKNGSFEINKFVKENYSTYTGWSTKKLLKIGQKVIVFKNDDEFKNKESLEFLKNRLYKITQFGTSDNNIYLKYHLESQADGDIDKFVKIEKDLLLRRYEKKFDLPEIKEDETITDKKAQKEDYENRKYSFFKLTDYRFKRLINIIGKDEFLKIKIELDKLKKQSAKIEVDGKTPLLKMESKNWNFLYEGEDFEISLMGMIEWLKND
jgi:CRISPR-associated endonuclease Csn1